MKSQISNLKSEISNQKFEIISKKAKPIPRHEFFNPKPKTQNPKPKTQNPKPKTQNPKPKTQNPKPKTLDTNPPLAPVPVHAIEPLPENRMAIAGFIMSMIGIVTCGTLSIIGVILSAIGIRKQPKGFAVAGLIVGLIGLIELAAIIMFSFASYRFTQGIVQIANTANAQFQLQQEAAAIGDKWEELGRIPSQAEGDKVLSGSTDNWANPICYETDGSSFTIRSWGADGISHTGDDVVVGPFEDATSAQEQFFGDSFEDFEFDTEAADDASEPDAPAVIE